MFVVRESQTASRSRALVASLLGLAAACGGSDGEESTDSRTDEQACDEFCSEVPVSCPTIAAQTPGLPDHTACTNACVAEQDSSTHYRRCLADAKDCDGISACKQAH